MNFRRGRIGRRPRLAEDEQPAWARPRTLEEQDVRHAYDRYLTWRNKEKGSSKAAVAQFSRVTLYRH